MPTEQKKELIQEGDGTQKEVLTIKFSNGALEQLESLQAFLGTNDPLDVVKAGISLLQQLKEKKADQTPNP